MEPFDLFDRVQTTYDEKCKDDVNIEEEEDGKDGKDKKEDEGEKCGHKNTIVEKDTMICIECGEEIVKKTQQDKDWRLYHTDSKKTNDISRTHIRKIDEKSIDKDVENLGFPDSIVIEADKLYAQVTEGKIFRGNSRRSIVFGCITSIMKIVGKSFDCDDLINVFGLNKKTAMKGLKFVNLKAPKKSNIRTTYITPLHLIEEIMNKFNATPAQKKEVQNIYKKIRNKSSKLNRSRPQSLASAVVFYWICSKGMNISLKDFTQKVNLSELTVNKVAKEIALVMKTPNVI